MHSVLLFDFSSSRAECRGTGGPSRKSKVGRAPKRKTRLLVVSVSRRKRRRTRCSKPKIGPVLIVVWLPIDFRCHIKIFSQRRRGGGPLKTRRRPWIRAGHFAVAHRPCEINHWQEIAQRQNRSSRSGHHVEHLELRRIVVIAARHAEIAKNELWKESQVKAKEQEDRGYARQKLWIKFSSDLRPPEMQSADIAHHRAAHHDVVEMRHDEVGVVDMNVEAEAGQEQAG